MNYSIRTRSAVKSKENAITTSTPNKSSTKRSTADMSVVRKSTVRKCKRPKQDPDASELPEALEKALSLHNASSNNSSDSFQTRKENSSMKLNVSKVEDESFTVTVETSNEMIEVKSVLSKSAFDHQLNYEELEELPEQFDYQGVKLKENVFIGYEDQKSSLHFLIKTAIEQGESGTVLVFGGQRSESVV